MKRARPDMRSLDSDPPGAAHAARNKWYPADTVFCLDRQFRHLSVACDRSGTPSASFAHYVGKSPRELRLDPRLDRRLRAECAALLRTGKPRVFEARVAGTRLTHRLVPERAHGGRITSILGIVRKVHDHRSTHAPAQAPQPSLADVTANMAELFQVVEPILDRRGRVTDFRYLEVNPATEQLTGLGRSEILGKTARQLRPIVEDEWINVVGNVHRTGQASRAEGYSRALDTSYDMRAWKIDDRRVALVITNLTRSVRAEQALRESAESFQALLRASSDKVYRMSADWSELRMLVGKNVIADSPTPFRSWLNKYIPPDERALVMSHVRRAVRTGKIFELEHRVRRADGTIGWTHSRAIPILDARGKVREWFGMASDVSARREAEERLRASEARLRLSAKAANIGFWEWDLRRNTVHFSPEWKRQIGYGEHEVADRFSAWQSRVHPDDLSDTVKRLQAYIAQPKGRHEVEFRFRRKDGHYIWIHSQAALLNDEHGKPQRMLGCHIDVTARKRVEAELKESREHLRQQAARLAAILDTAADSIITINGQGQIRSINRAGEKMFGYSAAELVGRNVSVLMPSPYRDEHDTYLSRYRRTGERRIIGIGRQARARRRDGTIFPVDLAVSEVFPGELFTGFIRDISDRVIGEQRMRDAERMVSIATMAAGLGHDMNNMLMPLRAHINVAAASTDSPEVVRRMKQVTRLVDYLQEMADGLHHLATDGGTNHGPAGTNLRTWWSKVGSLLSKLVPRHVALKISLPASLPPVAIAERWLTQAVMNLIINAGQAIPPPCAGKAHPADPARRRVTAPGTVRISARAVGARRAAAAQSVRLVIGDNGVGMCEEVKRRASELFFTTKPPGIGTGLGLPIVGRIVGDSGGTVKIDSHPGEGTRVTLTLPVVPRRGADDHSRAAPQPANLTAALHVPNRRVASIIGHVLGWAGVALAPNADPHSTDLWIVDSTETSPDQARRWAAHAPPDRTPRTVVAVGPFRPQSKPAWNAAGAVLIERPDDFFCVRNAIEQAVRLRRSTTGDPSDVREPTSCRHQVGG